MTLLSSPTKVGELAEPSGISLHVISCIYDTSSLSHYVSDDLKSVMSLFFKNSSGRGGRNFCIFGQKFK